MSGSGFNEGNLMTNAGGLATSNTILADPVASKHGTLTPPPPVKQMLTTVIPSATSTGGVVQALSNALPPKENADVKAFADFCLGFASDPVNIETVFNKIKDKIVIPKLFEEIKAFYEDEKRQSAKHALNYLSVETALVASLAIHSLSKEKDTKDSKEISRVFLQHGGPILQSLVEMGAILKDEGISYSPSNIFHIRTEAILNANGSHNDKVKSFASIDEKASATVSQLKEADVYVLECVGKIGDKEKGIVRDDVPPTGDVFASMMKYFLKHDPAAVKVVCGEYHDVTKAAEVAISEAKIALETFLREHVQWTKGADIPPGLLGQQRSKGEKISFPKIPAIYQSDSYILLARKLNEIFAKNMAKKQLFIDASIRAAVSHLIKKFIKHKNFGNLKELKRSYQIENSKVNRQTRHRAVIQMGATVRARSGGASTTGSDTSPGSSSSGSPRSDDDGGAAKMEPGMYANALIDPDILALSTSIAATAKKVSEDVGISFEEAKAVVVDVTQRKGGFNDRSNSPPRAPEKKEIKAGSPPKGSLAAMSRFTPKPDKTTDAAAAAPANDGLNGTATASATLLKSSLSH